jgi:hypothetical protein
MLSVSYAAQSLKSSISKKRPGQSTFPPYERSAYSDKSCLVFNRFVKYEGPDPPSAHLDSADYTQSGLAGWIVLRRIDKLTNLRPLFLNIGKVLFSQLLIDFDLFLGRALLAGANISLP